MTERAPVYLDYNATTPLAPEVETAVRESLGLWGNPSSGYRTGARAREVVLVELNTRIASILEFNVEELDCRDRATVVRADALGPAALAQAPRDCDLVFLDPPYALWEEEPSRERILDLAARCRANMKDASFLILRTPTDFPADFPGIPGFDGPETHPYAEDMFVHLFAPSA